MSLHGFARGLKRSKQVGSTKRSNAMPGQASWIRSPKRRLTTIARAVPANYEALRKPGVLGSLSKAAGTHSQACGQKLRAPKRESPASVVASEEDRQVLVGSHRTTPSRARHRGRRWLAVVLDWIARG